MKEEALLSSMLKDLIDKSFIEVKVNKRGILSFNLRQYKKPKSKSKNTDWKQRISNFKKM